MTRLMDRIDKVLQEVLPQITPTENERKETENAIEKIKEGVSSVLKKKGLDFTVAGSYARDTWMKDKKEFDIFILFPPSYSRERLEKEGLETGVEIVKTLKGRHKIAYAEHPYVRAKIGKYDVDIVPCYKVESAYKIKSAVDRTPFHNEWLSKHLLPSLAPDIRLLKQFTKSNGLYGSDARVQGFSGYLCELLIIHYDSFKNLIFSAADWKPGKTMIDLEGEIKYSRELHNKFRKHPLIVIDPVDPGRNVAACLSPSNFMDFVSLCRAFIRKPSADFFFPRPFVFVSRNIENILKKRGTFLTAISFRSPKVLPDILWPQLRKTGRRIKSVLEDNDFNTINCGVWSNDKDKCIILLEFDRRELPRIRKTQGPSIFSDRHSREFLSKYSSSGRVWVEDDFWVAEIPRKNRTFQDIIKTFLSGNENQLHSIGVPSHIARQIEKGFEILNVRNILKLGRTEPDFGKKVHELLTKNVLL